MPIKGHSKPRGGPQSFGVPIRRYRVSTSTPPRRPRPPSFVVDGDYPHFYSPNLLSDPGFEFTLQNSFDRKPRWDYEDGAIDRSTFPIPHYSATCTGRYPFHWPDPASTCFDDYFWMNWYQLPSTTHGTIDIAEDASWRVATINPHTGNYHLAWWRWTAVGAHPSSLGVQGIGLPYPMSARVQPGDAVTWSVWAAVMGGLPAVPPNLEPHLVFYTQTGSPVKDVFSSTALVNAYTQYTSTANAPPGSYYARCYLMVAGPAVDSAHESNALFVDDGRVGVE